MSFKSKTGLLGGTEPGQKVTIHNIHKLPVGSVVSNADGSRIIHLHDDLWLWCCDGAHCYDNIQNLLRHVNRATLCHIP